MHSRTAQPPFVPQIRLYQDWLRETRGLQFDSYDALWRWSVSDLDAFWQSIWDYFDVQSPTPHTAVLARNGRATVAALTPDRHAERIARIYRSLPGLARQVA